jgi:hypothetical protein
LHKNDFHQMLARVFARGPNLFVNAAAPMLGDLPVPGHENGA